MKKHTGLSSEAEKNFMTLFQPLCRSRNTWEVWTDIMTMIACSFSNASDRSLKRYEKREKEYAACMERLGSVEAVAKILKVIVMALEDEPEQDFLGKMYMNLNLGDHWKGQFFTPYDVCKAMSEMTCENVDGQIEEKGYISICDPACGAGATMIAAANTVKKSKYNFQNHVLFVGQDVDRVVGMMAYIQLSLLGCPGYIVIANTITNPIAGPPLMPIEKEGQEFWYTPLYFGEVWNFRRAFSLLKNISGTGTTQKTVEKERYFMFFDFKEQEVEYGNQRN